MLKRKLRILLFPAGAVLFLAGWLLMYYGSKHRGKQNNERRKSAKIR